MSLVQTGATVTGTWQTSGGTVEKHGSIAGTTTTTAFSGTFTFIGTTIATGLSCSGTMPVSGPDGGTSLIWTSTGVVGGCSDPPTNVTLSVNRQ